MTIRRILEGRNAEILTCEVDFTVSQAVARLGEHRIGALPVIKDGAVVGIFSERDVIYKLRELGPRALDMPVQDAMTAPAVTVSAETSALAALSLMTKRRIRHLPVLKHDKLVGILSLTDLMRLSFSDNFGETESDADLAVFRMLGIRHVMKTNPETISPAQTVREAAEILASREFHALPVVEGDTVVGMVTTTDLIRYFLKTAAS